MDAVGVSSAVGEVEGKHQRCCCRAKGLNWNGQSTAQTSMTPGCGAIRGAGGGGAVIRTVLVRT